MCKLHECLRKGAFISISAFVTRDFYSIHAKSCGFFVVESIYIFKMLSNVSVYLNAMHMRIGARSVAL